MESLARRVLPSVPDSAFAWDMLAGLETTPKSLPSKYFYDSRGSELFDRISELPEYYLTRTEMTLLRTRAAEIAAVMGSDVTLVEFGAGSLKKVGIVLDALPAAHAYMPIDISGEHLSARARTLGERHPKLTIVPVVADFTAPLELPIAGGRLTGFFPGSTIGNLAPPEALAFLKRAKLMFKGSGILVGVDLVKDPAILHAAYNDASGVTAAFNKNILARANRELEAGFDLDAFAHYAYYNPSERRIEMHLVSLGAQRVRVADSSFVIREGESIHTENSYKYTVEEFRSLAREAGLVPRQVWHDRARLFSLHWLEA